MSTFKAFFRSRSRSRSSSQPSPPSPDSVTPLPRPRHPSSSDNPPSSYTKSPLRSQNRPISSTTTATHSTITPLPSDTLRNRSGPPRHAYAHHNHSTDTQDHDRCSDYDYDDNHLPRSETPSSTRRKLLWHSFFGISLTRRSSSSVPSQSTTDRKGSTSTSASDPAPRKRSFRLLSRPATPKSIASSLPIPTPSSPLPLSASPRRRSFGLGSSQRSTPKSSTAHLPLPHVQPGRTHGRRHSVASERPPHDSAVALPEESSHRIVHRATLDGGGRHKGKQKEKRCADPSLDFPLQSLPTDPSPACLSSHLPRHPVFRNLPTVDSVSLDENDQSSHPLNAIPQIIHTPPTPQRPGEGASSPSPSIATPPNGKTVPIPHREQLLVSSTQSHADAHHTPSPKGRFTPRFLSTSKVKNSDEQKLNRRPPAGSSRNMTNHRGKLGSFDFERPVSALNRSTSTVDRHKTHVRSDNASYSKAHLPSLERTMSNDSARGGQCCSVAGSPLKPDHTGSTSVISFSSVSLQTKSTGRDAPTGQSSSWGRASGRRILSTSHGTFAFESPSSLPSSPNLHTFHLPNEPNQGDRREYTASLPQSRSSPRERKAKGKGRSLDLGLGLSWAPSRLREEILMPGFILSREKAKADKNRTHGVDVTKMFERLLSESQFQTFKSHVRRFDAHVIPLKGPSGLLACVDDLLAEAGLGERERSKLVTEFSVFVESHSG